MLFVPRTILSRSTFLGLILLVVASCCAVAAEAPSPLSPDESLKHFQLDPGLAIELVACEPEVVDPIAIRFDEDGRLWVVEMRDYPHGPQPGEAPRSTIRVLSDRDADGRYEASQVFADGLLFPTGLQPWLGGVIVTLAGEVIYLKDTDGDGRADLREVWFRGFAAENPQLRANHPRLGLDGRVYIANGLRGGAIVDARLTDPKPLSISGMDFRFDPRSGRGEAISGNGQFGLTFDDFGNRFVCNNRAPLDHVVLENQYLARNPFLAVPAVLSSVAAAGEASRVYPLTSAWTTSNLHAGQFTAACGVEIYRGEALGPEYLGNAFVCEPTGSLVHRETLRPDGVTFASRPAHEARAFLATPDAWFRPVNLEIGPDGALYVVDMYRAVIEHPQFMPSELQNRPDMRLGDDRGRIYRVVRSGRQSRPPAPRLSRASSAELVAALQHTNGWWRDTAARLLYERQDAAVKVSLETLAAEAPEAVARGTALWALEGLGSLTPKILEPRLADEHPRVREQAVALTEARLNEHGDLRHAAKALAGDADPRVRFRAALALGGLRGNDAVESLLAIALAAPDDVWTRRAVTTALPENTAPLLLAALSSPRVASCTFDAPELILVGELAKIVGSRREAAEIVSLLNVVVDPSRAATPREAALDGLATGLERRGGSLRGFVSQAPQAAALRQPLDAVFERAMAGALDEILSVDERAAKIDLVKRAQTPHAAEALLHIVSQDAEQALRARAAAALAAYDGEEIGPALLASYPAQTPAVRRAILDALVAQGPAARRLLDAIESGDVARAELGSTRETALRRHGDTAVRSRAEKLLVPAVPAERKQVLAAYRKSLDLDSDPRAGKELFRKHCAGCHRIGDLGINVAPDISDSRVKTAEQLLVDILNPNQAIDNNYLSYTVVTKSGTIHTGILTAETASSITLRQQENKSVDLLRADVESIRSSGVSLMPEGLEKNLSQRELADLISFVKNWRYLEQVVPGTIGAQGK